MKKKNLGCIGWIVLFPLLLVFATIALAFAVIVGIIYGMFYGYKKGKFDKITAKINELIGKLYKKVFKNELSKPILSPKGFTIITTILIFFVISAFGSGKEGIDPDITNHNVASEQSNSDSKSNSNEENNKDDIEEVVETENIIETTDAEIHFINTGNSDSILIKQDNKAALIDAGDNDDEGKVVSYLKQQSITELEYVFATHPHADHIGGLDAVVDAIPVKNVYVSNGDADTKTYSDFITSMANKGLNPSVPLLNSEFNLGTSTFKVLSVANESDPNNNSIVLLYINGEDKILLMGDAESQIESIINTEDVDLLKVGHHGSNTSSSSAFIDKINPEYAVITVDKSNQYGHPHKETMDTLENRDIEVHRSDECGHIVFKSSGNGLTVDCKKGSYDAGENQEVNINSNSVVAPEPEVSTSEEVVYWTSSGKKYHSNPNCSNMNSPSAGSISESGRTPCKKCY